MSGFFRRSRGAKAPSSEKPLRDELLSIERLEERGLALAASFITDPSPRRRARNIFPRFDDNARVLRDAYRTLADDVRTGQFVTAAAEWLYAISAWVEYLHVQTPAVACRHLEESRKQRACVQGA